jgi:hypothetical protein
VQGKTGYLVPVGDEAAFADRVQRLLGDKRFMVDMGFAARAEAERCVTTHGSQDDEERRGEGMATVVLRSGFEEMFCTC